jgi:hypothetical protein
MANTILKSYKRDNDDELQTSITRVVERWENNPKFLDPPPAYVALKTLLPELRSAVANAKGRDSVAISLKKDLKVKAIGYMSELDAWVTEKSKGDRTMLLESGFYISGDKNRVIPEPEITKLEVVLGRAGILTTKIKKVARCRGYWHQYATELPNSATTWHSESSLNPEFTFTGLTSGRMYWVRVAIYSKTGQWVYSPVESRIVQ